LTELAPSSARQRAARLLLRLVRNRISSECELFSHEDMGAYSVSLPRLPVVPSPSTSAVAFMMEMGPNFFRLDTPRLRRIAEN